jgi:hypothetical protein
MSAVPAADSVDYRSFAAAMVAQPALKTKW